MPGAWVYLWASLCRCFNAGIVVVAVRSVSIVGVMEMFGKMSRRLFGGFFPRPFEPVALVRCRMPP